jgi:hypothetical protein
MNSRALRFTLIAFSAVVAATAAHAQAVLSNFASNVDGWTRGLGDSGSSVSWTATGGVGGGGGLVLNDSAGGQNDYFAAPAKFLGNQAAYYGGTLSFDLEISFTVGAGDLPEGDNVILTGNGTSIVFTLPAYPVPASFTTYSINLTAASGWYITGTSTAPTTVQMQGILGNLTDFRILGDWHNGVETDVLDNVQLTAIPEPSIAALSSGLVVLGLGMARRRGRSVLGPQRT